ncbi:MAG: hypothetical protein FWF59_02585 [Turicibacter sp.]|nr:hypothetical protein [Turicibacter sp.]
MDWFDDELPAGASLRWWIDEGKKLTAYPTLQAVQAEMEKRGGKLIRKVANGYFYELNGARICVYRELY